MLKRYFKVSLGIIIPLLLFFISTNSVNAQVTCFYSVAFNTCTTLSNECTPQLECPDFGDCCTKAWFEGGQTQEACPQTIACVAATPTSTSTPTPTTAPGTTATPTPVPSGPVDCDPGYSCDFVPGGTATCTNNAGYSETCLMPNGSSTGNCCRPLSGVYLCSGNGVSDCTTELGIGYGCDAFGANFGPCPAGDDSCTSCDELSPNSCDPVSSPLPCVEQNETIGYRCESTIDGCYPCFEGDTVFGCFPEPEYSTAAFGSSEAAFEECAAACAGLAPTQFRCDEELGCVESGSGPYNGYAECALSCNAPSLFCTDDGHPVAFPTDENGNPRRIYTAIGCLPIADFTQFAQFFISIGISIAGGLSLLLMGIAGILMKTSAGNPQRLQAGRELLTAAIAGLMLVIFSAFVLRVLGVNILGIAQL